MKIVRFDTEQGFNFGIRKWVWTYGNDLHLGYVYMDIRDMDEERWFKRNYESFGFRCTCTEESIIKKWAEIQERAHTKKKLRKSRKGIPVSYENLLKRHEEREEEKIQNDKISRLGAR